QTSLSEGDRHLVRSKFTELKAIKPVASAVGVSTQVFVQELNDLIKCFHNLWILHVIIKCMFSVFDGYQFTRHTSIAQCLFHVYRFSVWYVFIIVAVQ